jgi:hypothetical protein
MTSWGNKEQATMNSSILNITFTHGGKFFTQISTMLVFNVLNNWFPTVQK